MNQSHYILGVIFYLGVSIFNIISYLGLVMAQDCCTLLPCPRHGAICVFLTTSE